MTEQPIKLDSALKNLELAKEIYQRAKDACGKANSDKCSAINTLNAAQKQFDAAVARIKEGASSDSDWGRKK